MVKVATVVEDFLIELMLDADEDVDSCCCRICQRLRRARRGIEATPVAPLTELGDAQANVQGESVEGDILP